jgi:folylpolyglutamate synthase/dihydropteroate synthase
MELPEEYGHALANTVWPGRAQVIADWGDERADNLVFCLDGAHTGESAATCAEWFADEAGADSVKVLLFNCLKARPAGLSSNHVCMAADTRHHLGTAGARAGPVAHPPGHGSGRPRCAPPTGDADLRSLD